MPNVGELTAQLTADLGQLRQGMRDAEKLMEQYENSVDRNLDQAERRWDKFSNAVAHGAGTMRTRIGSIVSRLGGLQAAMGGLALGAGFFGVMRSFSQLDQGLINISKTADLTGDKLNELESNIHDLAREIPVSTDSLLGMASTAGQLGVEGVENITNFTETVGKLQTASDLAGEEGAKQLARLLNTAGEGTDKVDELGSVIVRLGNNMAATEKEIAHMASEIGRGTAAFEVSSEQAVALGAALRAMGARAELSGSAIARTMIEIQKALDKGGSKLEQLTRLTEMTGGQLRETFAEDSMEVFTQFIRGVDKAAQRGNSITGILEQFGMSGTEAAKGLSPLIQNTEMMDRALRMANEEVRNATALNEEAAKAADSFGSQMRLTMNAVNEIASRIGEGFSPVIIDLAEDTRDWVAANDEWIQQDLPGEVKDIAGAFGDLLGSIQDLVTSDAFKTLMSHWEIIAGTGGGFLVGGPWGALTGFGVGVGADAYRSGARGGTQSGGVLGVGEGLGQRGLNATGQEMGGANREMERAEANLQDLGPLWSQHETRTEEVAEATKMLWEQMSSLNDQVEKQSGAAEDSGKAMDDLLGKFREWRSYVRAGGIPEPRSALSLSALAERQRQMTISYQDIAMRGVEGRNRALRTQAMAPPVVGRGEFDRVEEEAEQTFDYLEEFSRQSARNMQSNFSNFFFDGMKGELNSLEDFASSVFDTILRVWADTSAKMAARGLFGQEYMSGQSGQMGGLAGILGKGIGNMFSSGGGGGSTLPGPDLFRWSGGSPTEFHQGGILPEDILGFSRSGNAYSLQRGETVSPSHGGGGVEVHIHGAPEEPEVRRTPKKGGRGERLDLVFARQMSDQAGRDGPFTRALEERYGLTPRLQGR